MISSVRRFSTTTLAVVLAFGLFVSAGTPTAHAADKVVQLWTLMTQPERIEGMQRVIAHFEQANPGIKVELTSVGWAEAHTKFMAAVAGGNPPDIAVESYGWPITYSQMGILQPVDDVIEAIGEENILPQDLKLNFYGGHYWGVPLYGTPSVLYYRKDVFEAKGLSPPTTWDELLETAKMAHDPDNDLYGFVVTGGAQELTNVMIWDFLSNNGASIFNDNRPVTEDDVAFNSKETIETFEYLKKLHAYSPPGSEMWGSAEYSQMYPTGRTAMVFDMMFGHARILTTAPEMKDKIAVAELPVGPSLGDRQGSFLYNTVGLMVFKDAGEPEAAKEFLKFLMKNDDVYVEWLLAYPFAMWPVTYSSQDKFFAASALQEFPDHVKLGLDVLPKGSVTAMYHGATPFWGEMEARSTLAHVMQRILIDKWSVEDAVAEGEENIKEIVREYAE